MLANKYALGGLFGRPQGHASPAGSLLMRQCKLKFGFALVGEVGRVVVERTVFRPKRCGVLRSRRGEVLNALVRRIDTEESTISEAFDIRIAFALAVS